MVRRFVITMISALITLLGFTAAYAMTNASASSNVNPVSGLSLTPRFTQIDVSWDAAQSVSDYWVKAYDLQANSRLVQWLDICGTSVTLKNLAQNDSYKVTVWARPSAGGQNAHATANTSGTAPAPPLPPVPSQPQDCTNPSPTPFPSPTPTPTPTGTETTPPPPPPVSGNIDCNYQTDTWSGDAGSVGYSVTPLSHTDGSPSSFSVKINANKGTTEVVGYPSDQCLMYSALPASLKSSFTNQPPANSSGLDYEFAYDVWLTTAANATSFNWDNDLELMVWTYNNGQTPAGDIAGHLSDGSTVWTDGDNTTGIVSVVLPANQTSGTVDLASLIVQLKGAGYVNTSRTGVLDVEYGIEAPYGGGQTFGVNPLTVAS